MFEHLGMNALPAISAWLARKGMLQGSTVCIGAAELAGVADCLEGVLDRSNVQCTLSVTLRIRT
jgi:hypothetical protein